MRIFVLGDPHFKKNNIHVFGEICDEIITILDERKPDLCVCLGDTLDTHDRIYLRAQCMAIRFFKKIAQKCPLIILIGNHDRENNSDFMSDIHPFVGLEDYPNITVVYETVRETRQNHEFIYVPYVPPGRFLEALQHVNYTPTEAKNQLRLIFCHQEFVGCDMGNVVSTKGDRISPNFPLTIAGHIHKYQTLPQIVYVGTFLQQNYGEDEDKALMMLHLDNGDDGAVGRISIGTAEDPCSLRIERIHLKTPPNRKTINMTLEELPNFAELIPADNIQEDWVGTGGTLTRVILHVDATETKSLKTNPFYQSLKNTVDKVDVRTEGNKASIAEQMVKHMKESGHIQKDKLQFSLEEIIRAMLRDDSFTLKLFEEEVLETQV